MAIHIHYPIATLFGDGTSLVKGESGGPELYRNSWGAKPKPNQTNTPGNTKISNIAIHIHYPIAALIGDGTSLVEGESDGPELYRNLWAQTQTQPNQHTMQHQDLKHSHTHALPHSNTVWGWGSLVKGGYGGSEPNRNSWGPQTKPTQQVQSQHKHNKL